MNRQQIIEEILKYSFPPFSPSITTAQAIIARTLGKRSFSLDGLQDLSDEDLEKVLSVISTIRDSNEQVREIGRFRKER